MEFSSSGIEKLLGRIFFHEYSWNIHEMLLMLFLWLLLGIQDIPQRDILRNILGLEAGRKSMQPR